MARQFPAIYDCPSQAECVCILNTMKKLNGTVEQLPQMQAALRNHLVEILTIIKPIFRNPLGANLLIPINKVQFITDHY